MKDKQEMESQRATPRQAPMAIIGMGCLFPKADGLDAYWANIKEGVDAITEVPESHWRPEDYYDADQKTPDMTYGRRGGFLSPFEFDPLKYGIPPNVLQATDTSQLLSMVVAEKAMQDAGYGLERDFNRRRVSVILGVTGALELVVPLGARLGHPIWRKSMREAGIDDARAEDAVQRISDSYVPWQENSFPGLLGNVVAGRVSKFLDTGGTNCVVDAACASSLSALHLASMELATGVSDMVVTGGIDTFNDIFMYMCFSKTPALSPTGNAKPFDAQGDGTILGEGLGMVVLKRLADAERDGDRIYAVLKGVGSSSDGKGDAIYAPSSEGQMEALRAAYEGAGVDPQTIEFVEAHGTGTERGDAVEVKALRAVYGELDGQEPWCALGSVKSQIGHTKAAAGAAGLIKTVLALHNKVLPPTIKVEQPLDDVAPGTSPFYVNTSKRPWVARDEHRRRAGISSFGFGGSNFHCVLEEYAPEKAKADWDGDVQLVAFSGETPGDLEKALDAFPVDGDWAALRDLGTESRAAFRSDAAHRLVLVVERGQTDLAKLVGSAKAMLHEKKTGASWSTPDGAFYGSGAAEGKLGFVFPGQGAQYVGMLRGLVCQFPEMLQALGEANALCGKEGDAARLSDYIYAHPTFDKAAAKDNEAALTATDVAQPAIGAVSLGAVRVLESFGVRPEATAGHSYGELTAMQAAGRLDADDFLRVSALRGRLMGSGQGDRGSMIAVRAPLEEVEAFLEKEGIDLIIANKNAPDQAVLSGATAEVDKAAKRLKDCGMRGVKLPVAAAFHSKLVSEASGPFLEGMSEVNFAPGRVPVFSNSTGQEYPEDASEARELLASQLARPVEFVNEIVAMYASGVRIFLEVGPGARMTGLVKSILAGHDHKAIAIDASQGKKSGIGDLARALALLAAEGREVALGTWDPDHVVSPGNEKKARMTVSISGANYRAPVKEKKETPKALPAAPPVPAASAPPVPAASAPPVPAASAPLASAAVEKRVAPSSVPAPQKAATTPVVPMAPRAAMPASGALADLLRQAQENIAALQQMQEQTAELHRQFLEGQETAGRTYQTLLEQQQRLFQAAGSGATIPDARPAVAPAPVAPVVAPTAIEPEPVEEVAETAASAPDAVTKALLEVVAEKTGYPAEMLDLDMSLDADLGIDSIKRVEILSALQDRIPELPAVEAEDLGAIQTLRDVVDRLGVDVPASAAPAPDTGALQGVLMEMVAEKTGYPAEMLELDMSLDADLGIDSIKRVEILSALQERMPELPTVEAEDLGRLETLRDVVEHLSSAATSAGNAGAGSGDAAVGGAVKDLMLATISAKTGYPVEMLELDMSLDADLGIDSIKRVEILSSLQDEMPGLPEVNAEDLGALQTIRDVVEYLETPGGKPADAREKAAPVAAKAFVQEDYGTVERSVLSVVELGEREGRHPARLRGSAEIWVSDDGSEFAGAVVERLRSMEFKPELVSLDRPRDGARPEKLDGLIIIAPEAGMDDGFLKQAFELTQFAGPALRKGGENGGALLATLSRLDGAFGLANMDSDFESAPLSGGLAGLSKTAAQEWPEVACRVLDVANDFSSAAQAALDVVDELINLGPLEVGLSKAGRRTLELRPAALGHETETGPLKPGDVVVISGGARGVTAEVAVTFARAYKPTLVLLGRSDEPVAEDRWLQELSGESSIKRALLDRASSTLKPKELEAQYRAIASNREILETSKRIEAEGAKVLYRSVDIRDQEAVARTLREVRNEVGPIAGLVHGAGVLADRLIEDKTREQFDLVYDTKVVGMRNLLDALRDDPLGVVVFFSSSSGRLGRSGQVDYSMANEVLNKTAQAYRRARPECRVVSVNWGPWDGGMVTPSLKKVFEGEGVGLIGLKAGAEYLVRELAASGEVPVEVVVMGPSPAGKDASHTLLATDGSLSTVFEVNLDAEAFPFLRSHVMDGKAVLPMALYVEWFAHAALHGNPGLRFQGVDDLRVMKGLILEPGECRTVGVRAGKAVKKDGAHAVPVELQSTAPDGRAIVHARAEVVLGAKLSAADDERCEVALDPYSKLPEEFYGNGLLFHGPDFQGIQEVEGCSNDGIAGLTKTAPRPADWIANPLRKSWIADPLVLDSGFQLMILWSFARHDAGSLPCYLGRYRQYQASFPKGRVRITAKVTEDSAHRALATLEFTNPSNGRLIARMEQYECVIDATLNSAFQRNQLAQQPLGE